MVVSSRKQTPTELKIEQRYTGNLFIETWSNREWGSPGWLHTTSAEKIGFYFLDQDRLFVVDVRALKDHLLNQTNGTLDEYREVKAKTSGPNDTYGRLVPIEDLRAAQLADWWEANPRLELEHAAV